MAVAEDQPGARPAVAEAAGSAAGPAGPSPTLLDRWRDWRNRRLMSPGFQSRAARFPLTRPIAAQQASALFDLCAGFVYAQILSACVRLGLLDLLAERPRARAALAAQLGLAENRADRLLRAAVALGLAEARSGGRIGLGPRGASVLGNPGLIAMVRHHELLYRHLTAPVALLKPPAGPSSLARFWPYSTAPRAASVRPAHAASHPAFTPAPPRSATPPLPVPPLHLTPPLLPPA